MLDDLLKAKKITLEQYETYMLFQGSDMGRKWLERKTYETFMCEAPPELMQTGPLAHLDGRRSIIREIKAHLDHIEQLLGEVNHDRPVRQPTKKVRRKV